MLGPTIFSVAVCFAPIFDCEVVYWDRYLSVERCVVTDVCLWSRVFGSIFEGGALCCD